MCVECNDVPVVLGSCLQSRHGEFGSLTNPLLTHSLDELILKFCYQGDK